MEIFDEGRFGNTEFNDAKVFIEALTNMYDGYSWNGVDRLFNPFSLLKAVKNKELQPYWYKSGTPTFFKLIRQIKSEHRCES
jgi:hypothetical protein